MTVAPATEPIPATPMPSAEFLARIPADFARRHLLLSVGTADDVEQLHVSSRSDAGAIHNTGVRLERGISATVVDDDEALARAIDDAFGRVERDKTDETEPPDTLAEVEIDRLLTIADRDLLSVDGKGEVVRLVDALLFEALGRRASDVHVQPQAERTLVKYRVDGVLSTAREIPLSLAQPIVSRIKVMGRMDIAERRVPQDGRATVSIGGRRSIDLRISTMPTNHGERAVLRLLEDAGRTLDAEGFGALGMPTHVREPYLDRASRANGVILLTGPTGSGKTTTLYTTLRWLSHHSGGELNIMTVEDPIEYELSGAGVEISQSQVNEKKGVTFASGLRHILRQDPDVIMVGEIRDEETARVATQASLTGHLVFSTLHTNDSASAVTRLVDLGVEPYLVSASLSAVLAQRLVRRLRDGDSYDGRTGLYELLCMTDELRELIAANAGSTAIRDAAIASGMRRLTDEGRRLVDEQITTAAEIRRVAAGAS